MLLSRLGRVIDLGNDGPALSRTLPDLQVVSCRLDGFPLGVACRRLERAVVPGDRTVVREVDASTLEGQVTGIRGEHLCVGAAYAAHSLYRPGALCHRHD